MKATQQSFPRSSETESFPTVGSIISVSSDGSLDHCRNDSSRLSRVSLVEPCGRKLKTQDQQDGSDIDSVLSGSTGSNRQKPENLLSCDESLGSSSERLSKLESSRRSKSTGRTDGFQDSIARSKRRSRSTSLTRFKGDYDKARFSWGESSTRDNSRRPPRKISMRSRSATSSDLQSQVEAYVAAARKKASLLTNSNFEKNDSDQDSNTSISEISGKGDETTGPKRSRPRSRSYSSRQPDPPAAVRCGFERTPRDGSTQWSKNTSLGGKSATSSELQSQVEAYAAAARRKASLMTNSNFEKNDSDHDSNTSSSSMSSNTRGKERAGPSSFNKSMRVHRTHPLPDNSFPNSLKSRSFPSNTPRNNVVDDFRKYTRTAKHGSHRSRSRSRLDPEVDPPLRVNRKLEPGNSHCRPYGNLSPKQKYNIGDAANFSVLGKCLSGEDSMASSVSSMTSADSYMRQFMPRDFSKYRRHRRRRDEVNEFDIDEERESSYLPSFRTKSRSKSYGGDTSITGSELSRSNCSSANRASLSSAPVYQLEECCIKHPHILLSDQTNVDEWTCMRYCKDKKSGRWITVKKVCRACLQEMGDQVYEEEVDEELAEESREELMRESSERHDYDLADEQHSVFSESYKSGSFDDTCSLSDSQGIEEGKETINVHPTMGDDGNQTPLEREAEAQRRRFIRRLAARAYHFPGNTWCEDWLQYTRNTHLVFGIFFHHPLHPVTSRERCIILLGSVAVGLLMSNLIYLWFVHVHIGINDTVIELGPEALDVTKLMITLWTLGSFVHTCFDLSVWHIKACTLCRYGGHVSDEAVKCGRTAGVTIVMVTLAFATYLVLLRASENYNEDGTLDKEEEEVTSAFFRSVALGGGAESFDFLAGYIVEFILAVFLYNPLILTIVFTGVLGCNGRIPILGGRPREVAKEQRYAMKRQRYTMPQTLKLGDEEFEADMWGDANQKLATNF